MWTPSNTPMPGPNPFTILNSSSIASCTFTQLRPHWLQWDASHKPPKLLYSMGQSPIPSHCLTGLILGHSQSTIPNTIHTHIHWLINWQMVQITKPEPISTYTLLMTAMRLIITLWNGDKKEKCILVACSFSPGNNGISSGLKSLDSSYKM